MLAQEAERIRHEKISSARASGDRYIEVPCRCGDKVCKDWGIHPICEQQGAGFTEKEANIAAHALNKARRLGIIKGEGE